MAIGNFVIKRKKNGEHKLCYVWEIIIQKSQGTEFKE